MDDTNSSLSVKELIDSVKKHLKCNLFIVLILS